MMMIANAIPGLSNEQLYALVKDCEARIGSHVAGGDPLKRYVDSQRKIIDLVQLELQNRSKR